MITGTRHHWTCVLLVPALLLGCEAGSVLVGRTAGGPDPGVVPDDPAPPTPDPDGDADGDGDADPEPPLECDHDGDGWDAALCGGDDCDDDAADVHPDAVESEEWRVEVIAGDASWPALAMDVQGVAHVAVRAAVSGGTVLRYLTDRAGVWESTDVADIGAGSGAPSIAVGLDRRVHLCWTFTDGSTSEVVYSSSTGRNWRTVTLMTSAARDPMACSLAVDPRGVVHVAAADPQSGRLRHATLVDGAWAMETVADHAPAGTLPTMLIDVQYAPSVGYQDGPDGGLQYATRSPTGWHLETVVDAGGLSVDRSIGDFALSPDGTVRASYRDAHLRTLHYATNEDGAWASLALESAGYSGKSSSIVVDGNSATHLAYSRDDRLDLPDDLLFRTDAGGTWSNAQTIADEGSTGFGPQLAVGPHSLHVAFFRVGVGAHSEVLHARRALPDSIDRDCDGEL